MRNLQFYVSGKRPMTKQDEAPGYFWNMLQQIGTHEDVIKWKHCRHYWSFVHRSRGALMFSLICAWTSRLANNGDANDLRRHRAHYDVIIMSMVFSWTGLWDFLPPGILEAALNFKVDHFGKRGTRHQDMQDQADVPSQPLHAALWWF